MRHFLASFKNTQRGTCTALKDSCAHRNFKNNLFYITFKQLTVKQRDCGATGVLYAWQEKMLTLPMSGITTCVRVGFLYLLEIPN